MCELLCLSIMSHPMLLHRSVLYDHLQASEHTQGSLKSTNLVTSQLKEHRPQHIISGGTH